ncbi:MULTISPECIES: ubiquinol-cytochrome c reductase iron-sulfur subunit [Gammaproteobacteria]|uniref:ubiquinol-cytochrome c reductase iron-sulfur subunit n=1 Tax=Gammaproteobacteria TaxID=1236 RepID=UPI000C78D3FC|nr:MULTISPECIES: ubiquinol-cytochrome c reductase iron-sulfur subunit [Gammaproteobacteria]MBO9483433.1 ubiquinol-cytochrome c reductase iron-sulfur subunit [Salinisphaera sp. G21_0]MBO9496403.1 ubiquinol-cytochrome c reductase iron-sulfur subunit [Thalassotalea sp. G20_0]WBA82701.1 ubiquinol-cytochrome c reductase iron-sulfur subunit [Endozoicomonas sp. GU-1]WBA85631.1 ubiquinol-cytochrome c reductase iron-sulfur subunit [Endozoicomonas sp. GU-1]
MSDNGINKGRRRFLVAATSVVGAAGAVGVATPFLKSWNPSAKAKAAGAPVKVNLSKLEPGQQVVYEWRGKPVFVLRRTKDMLNELPSQDGRLRDPKSESSEQPEYATNPYRSRTEDVLVLVGLCTHLGCSPKYLPEVKPMEFDANWKGGYFCPCHGSRFDLAGRVYKGVPAPTNLVVPPYSFEGDDILIIGKDEENA